jgi:Cft2 family RNA processing exonuclease
MKLKQFIVLCVLASLTSGCVTSAKKMNRISLGMTKEDVINVLGEPDSMKAGQGVEVMEYMLAPANAVVSDGEAHWVFIKDGKVVQYGRAGDFGTSKDPTLTIQHR